jgi:hypothetical protein
MVVRQMESAIQSRDPITFDQPPKDSEDVWT